MKIMLASLALAVVACGGADKPAASPHDDSYTSTEHSGGSMNAGSPDGATPSNGAPSTPPSEGK